MCPSARRTQPLPVADLPLGVSSSDHKRTVIPTPTLWGTGNLSVKQWLLAVGALVPGLGQCVEFSRSRRPDCDPPVVSVGADLEIELDEIVPVT